MGLVFNTFQSVLQGTFEGMIHLIHQESQKIVTLIESRLNIPRILLISVIALASLSLLASLWRGAFLTFSLSMLLGATAYQGVKFKEGLDVKTQLLDAAQGSLADRVAQAAEHELQMAQLVRLKDEQKGLADQATAQVRSLIDVLRGAQIVIETAKDAAKASGEATIKLEAQSAFLKQWQQLCEKMLDSGDLVSEAADKMFRTLESFSQGQTIQFTTMIKKMEETNRVTAENYIKIETQERRLREITEALSKAMGDYQNRLEELQKIQRLTTRAQLTLAETIHKPPVARDSPISITEEVV